jgi:hypothetical protein
LSVPSFLSCIALRTFFDAALEYLRAAMTGCLS